MSELLAQVKQKGTEFLHENIVKSIINLTYQT